MLELKKIGIGIVFIFCGLLIYLNQESNLFVKSVLELENVTISQENLTEDEWMKKREEIYNQRKKRIQETCRKYGNWIKRSYYPPPKPNSYMVDKKHGLLYCRIAKAGTTTILDFFRQLLNIKSKMDNHSLHSEIPSHYWGAYQRILKKGDFDKFFKNNETLSFAFVRNPFERLVSAYKNKIFFATDPTYKSLSDDLQKNFTLFVDHVINEYKGCSKLKFQYCHIDVHWRRFIDRCAFCDLDFTVIGFMETFSEDFRYIQLKKGLLNKHYTIETKNSVQSKESASISSLSSAELFSEISQENIKKLYEIYQYDFELFGFEVPYYVNL